MSSFEEALVLWKDGLLNRLEMGRWALVGLNLGNVHQRMGVDPAREALEGTAVWFVRDDLQPPVDVAWRGRHAGLVYMTWHRSPPGGWLMAHRSSWALLLRLEQALLDGTPFDLREPLTHDAPAVRWWGLALADIAGRLDVLEAGLGDGDAQARLIATGCLRARGLDSPAIRAALRELLTHDALAWQAAVLIGDLMDLEALPLLTQRADEASLFVETLSFVEALPRLERELLHGHGYAARRALQRLGPSASPVVPAVVAHLRQLVNEPRGMGANELLGVLGDVGEVGLGAVGVEYLMEVVSGRVLPPWREWNFLDLPPERSRHFYLLAAEALGRTGDRGRELLGSLLNDPDEMRREAAVSGLAEAGSAAGPWSAACIRLLYEPSINIAAGAAIVLANTGQERAARDAWLEWEVWPLNHHATPPVLHKFADVLGKRLSELGPSPDPEDQRRTERALETTGQRTRSAYSVGPW